MITRRPAHLPRTLALVLAAVLVAAACDELLEPEAMTRLDERPRVEGIHPVVAIAGREGSVTRVELRLERSGPGVSIAAYQGELRYDPGAGAIAGAETSRAGLSAWKEVEPGRIRFAGAAPGGLAEEVVLTLLFDSGTPPEPELFSLEIEELIGVETFRNLVPEVVARPGLEIGTPPELSRALLERYEK